MRHVQRAVMVACLVAVVAGTAAGQDEGGGQSGADFLLAVPVTRSDAMGGVLDGQGNALEGILLNPAVLMLDPEFRLMVNLAPLPNGVTNSQVSVGVPIAEGMVGASAQLLSAGDFTYLDSSGQASGTVTLFDAAATAGYSQFVWDRLSVGASAKVVYRSLGTATAIAVGTDLGAAYWFETPHVGQRPKPPTVEQLENRRDRELASVDSENEKRTREAAGEVADLREQKTKLEETLSGLEADLAAAEQDDDTTRTEERIETARTELATVNETLASAETGAADDLAAVEAWYAEATASVRAAHSARLADLREVEAERARLFAVVDNPETTLSPEDIDENIEDAIARSREFLRNRTSALRSGAAGYLTSRSERKDEIDAQITHYKEQIAEVVGPEATQLADRISSLQDELTTLQATEEAAEEPSEANQERIKTLRSQVSDLQDQLDELESDPWVRRIRRRIADKEETIAAINADLEARAVELDERILTLREQTDREMERFENLRTDLQTELRRAGLRRELDTIDARNEKGVESALAEYEASEQAIYQRLLAAMYANEEKIFQSRLETARVDSENTTFLFESDLQDEREATEDDFAFEERFLERRLADLRREDPVNEEAVTEAENQLAALRSTYQANIEELDDRAAAFEREEGGRLDAVTTAIRDERQKVRLIYLQTDDPYQNTALTFAIRNLGTNLTFVETGYPMPRSAALGVSYTAMNTDLHRALLSTELEMPLYGEPTLEDLQIGIGAEYTFAQLASLRLGYAFGSPDRSFSAGFALDFALGFTTYAIDYAFRPLPDYGLQHTIGVAIGF